MGCGFNTLTMHYQPQSPLVSHIRLLFLAIISVINFLLCYNPVEKKMHNLKNILFSLVVLSLLFFTTVSSVCYANSPPPPTVSIIVSHPPEDIELHIGTEEAQRINKVFESYYIFYLGFDNTKNDVLTVTWKDADFEIALPQLQRYNNIFTLDIGKRTLSPGTFWARPYEFAAITIILTLLIEGLIFFLFGYRKRRHWVVFLVTNLVTQGFLYIWLNSEFYPLVNSYFFPVLFSLIVGEFLVFIIETAAFLILVRERSRWITFLYVIAANFASLVAGGLLINALI